LDIETEKLRKTQADLETERQKVIVAVAVLNIATTTDLLRGETLIHIQMKNIPAFIEDSSNCSKSPQFDPVLSQFNLFLTSISLSIKINVTISLAIHDCHINIKRKIYLRRKMNIKHCTMSRLQSCLNPHIRQMFRN
jgi:hypothetical protein